MVRVLPNDVILASAQISQYVAKPRMLPGPFGELYLYRIMVKRSAAAAATRRTTAMTGPRLVRRKPILPGHIRDNAIVVPGRDGLSTGHGAARAAGAGRAGFEVNLALGVGVDDAAGHGASVAARRRVVVRRLPGLAEMAQELADGLAQKGHVALNVLEAGLVLGALGALLHLVDLALPLALGGGQRARVGGRVLAGIGLHGGWVLGCVGFDRFAEVLGDSRSIVGREARREDRSSREEAHSSGWRGRLHDSEAR